MYRSNGAWSFWWLVLLIPGVLLVCFGLVALQAWVVEMLWNWLMPAIFGLRQITFWMSVGLVFLVDMLFGSIRSGVRVSREGNS